MTQSQKIEIFIIQLNGETLSLDVPVNANILDVKLQIAIREGIAQCQQELMFGDNLLHDRCNLTELGINGGAMLQLVVCDAKVTDEQCYACGRKNEFYNVIKFCRFCHVQQAREFGYFQDRR
jgi:hypothetical protein